MLRLSLRTLFSLTPSRSLPPSSILIARCSTSSPPHLTDPHSHSHPNPGNERVSVWWNLDTCDLRYDLNVFRGAQVITDTIKSFGIKGPIEIKAFGDMVRLAKTTQKIREALPSTTAIQFSHVPPDGNYFFSDHSSLHSSLFNDVMCWVSRNPPPAHIFLIILDKGCASLLSDLRMKNYNILLASQERAPIARNAATIMWDWDVLLRGGLGYLTGRYFNRPPRWYDHYDGPLDEPLIFSQDYFWRDIETFFKTEKGSFIIEESNIRSDMASYLLKYGPSVLESLPSTDVLSVVDKLIKKENWVVHKLIRNSFGFQTVK